MSEQTNVKAEEVVECVPVEVPTAEPDPMEVRVREEIQFTSAVRAYVEAVDRFEAASIKYNECHQAVCSVVKPNTKVVVRLFYGKHYLVTVDNGGGFKIEPISIL